MDYMLDDLLTTVKFKSAVYFKHAFCGAWGMNVPKGSFAQFHLVSSGSCMVHLTNEAFVLEKGDIIIFSRGLAHEIKASKTAGCRPGVEVVAEIMKGKKPFSGDASNQTQLVCGHYEMDYRVVHPIFGDLPEYVVVRSDEYGRYDLISAMIDQIIYEMGQQQPGYGVVSLKFAEILFVSIIRHYYINQSKKQNLFTDRVMYKVVDYIHKEINNDLSIKHLAVVAGMSRTLFIDRFKAIVGTTPSRYVANWRMNKAKYLLVNSQLSLLEIGEKIGYPSESSFNRAFKKVNGTSPGKYRRLHRVDEAA